MNDRDSWKADHYREEYLLAKAKLEQYQNYIQFLEEKYKIRKYNDFREEFHKWLKTKKDAQQKS